MKSSPIPRCRVLGVAVLTAACLLNLPLSAEARGPDDSSYTSHRYDHARRLYSAHPRSGFSVTFGTGYAGRGYYYGPPNSAYYYQRPDVIFYATRAAVPREYYNRESYSGNSTGAAVQSALARNGFYRGSIDGQIGPHQQAHGLRVTGEINSGLLRSLGM